MAVMMMSTSTENFFNGLFPMSASTTSVMDKVAYLEKNGAKIQIGLFQFSIKVTDGLVVSAQLPCSSSKVALHAVPEGGLLESIRQSVADVIEKALVAQASLPKQAFALGEANLAAKLAGAEKQSEPVTLASLLKKHSEPDTVEVPIAKPKSTKYVSPPSVKETLAASKAKDNPKVLDTDGLVSAVILLKDAKAIGQKCKGTSAGAVYRAFALGKVNLAAKLGEAGKTVSIRAESQDFTPVLKDKLKAASFSDNGTYMSIHVTLGAVPAIRTIGALLYSMDLEFDKISTNKDFFNV